LKFIEENPDTYLREISRELNLSPSTVNLILKQVYDFIEKKSVGLPNIPILIRLKEGKTPEGIIKFLKIKEKISLI